MKCSICLEEKPVRKFYLCDNCNFFTNQEGLEEIASISTRVAFKHHLTSEDSQRLLAISQANPAMDAEILKIIDARLTQIERIL